MNRWIIKCSPTPTRSTPIKHGWIVKQVNWSYWRLNGLTLTLMLLPGRQAGRRGRAQATGSGREREAAIIPRQCNLRTHYDLTSNNMYVVWFMFTVTVSNYSWPWLLNVVSYHNWQKYFNEILMVWRPWGLGRRCTRAQRILKNEILDGLQQRLDIN